MLCYAVTREFSFWQYSLQINNPPVSLFFHVIILKDNDDTSLKHR